MKKPLSGILSLIVILSLVFQGHVAYAVDATCALTSDEITVTNNVGKADTIYITDVMPGDIINVYNAATGGKVIAKATVGGNGSLTISIAQLGISSGSVYISDTSKGMAESSRTEADYAAEPVSDDPLASNVTITNNTGKADTVYVDGLMPGDILKIYNKATGGSLMGTATVGSNTTDVTKSFTQLGVNGGSLYLSVTSVGMRESNRVEADFSAEGYTIAPQVGNIIITNNVGKASTVDVSGLQPGDIIKIYTVAVGGSVLGTATVPSNASEVIKSFSQLASAGGTLYISDTTLGMHESTRTPMLFSAENQSNLIQSGNVTITNNTGKADTIYVDGLSGSDKVNVYTSPSGGTAIATGTVVASGSDVTISIAQLGKYAGTVYLSITSQGMLESARVDIAYNGESQSTSVGSSNIVVTNNAGTADTVYAYDLASGDVVNVYDSLTGGNLLGTATATGNDATVSISQLGTSAGTVYVSVTSSNKLESTRVPISYSAESQSTLITSDDISVTNNVGTADTVYVSELSAGDIIKVYDAQSGGNLLGTATVAASGTDGTVTISQLGTSAGTVYVSITSTNKLESSRIAASYTAQGQSTTINANNITVSNNSGKADTVYVSGLNAGDVINVYDSVSGGNLLGTATVATSSTNATVSIAQLGTGAGSVYVSVTSTNKIKSARTQASYSAEGSSTSITASNVVVTNNAGQPDTVQVDGLSDGEVVNVYDAAQGGNLLGTATVAQYSSQATITINQLGSQAGDIYVSATSPNDLESARVDVSYAAESQSNPINTANVSITNNSGAPDIVNVTGLSANDIVNVYNLGQGGNLLGTVTVAAGGTTASISILQLGTTAGSVYISVTSTNKSESARTQVNYSAEPVSNTPAASNIVVTNNAGIADTVAVTGLSATDVVNVYDSASGGTLLGTATVASYATSATVSINQLGTGAGNVYISVTSTSKLESTRTQVGFSAEAQSVQPLANNVIIVNNAGIAGTVTINNVSGGDIINVYDSAVGGNLLGTATVGTYNTSATISVNQLGALAGNAYVSITNAGKLESNRTVVAYSAKLVSSAPDAANITVVNNATIAGTVAVLGLQPNDVVNIYDSATNGTLLTTATVPSASMTVTLSLTQLAINGGNIYVSVQSTGKAESARTHSSI